MFQFEFFMAVIASMVVGGLIGLFCLFPIYATRLHYERKSIVRAAIASLHGSEPTIHAIHGSKKHRFYKVEFYDVDGEIFSGDCVVDHGSKKVYWTRTPNHLILEKMAAENGRLGNKISASKRAVIDQLAEENRQLKEKVSRLERN